MLIGGATTLHVESDVGILDYSLAADNRSTQAMAAIMVGLPLVGGAFGGTWTRFGLGAGAALVSGAWAVCALAVTIRDARPSSRSRSTTSCCYAAWGQALAAAIGIVAAASVRLSAGRR
jgi:hypothetical protein